MSYNITLNSSNLIKNGSNNMYQVTFKNGSFEFPEGTELCVSSATIPYSFVNVSSALGNNVLGYAIPAGSSVQYFSTTLADGFYDIPALNSALQTLFKSNGHYWVNTSSGTNNAVYYYPIVISSNYTLYTNAITSVEIPASASITTAFGTGYSAGSWSGGGYPTTLLSTNNFASLFIPETISSPSSLGYLLGFTGASSVTSPATANGSFYPSLGTTSSSSITSYGNSLSTPPFNPPLGSSINGLVLHCNVISNPLTSNSDILETIPITATYGANINYSPNSPNWAKVNAGKYNNLTIYFTDQSMNTLKMLDPNVLISLSIKLPEKNRYI